MKTSLLSILLFALAQPVHAQTGAQSAQALVEQGLKAGVRYPGLSDICDLTRPLITAGKRPASAQQAERRQLTPEQRALRASDSIVEPTKVFDNLYFVGTRGVASWVIQTSDGLIVVDALNNNEEAEKYIEGGLLKLGLDPKDIKYLLITHAHGDHYGGQEYIVNKFKPKVIMSEEDWRELEKPELQFSNPRWGVPPKRDISIKDGDNIKLGDTTVQLYVTPGHTPGTVSLIFSVKDGKDTHVVGLWGGTGLNFGPNEQRMRDYAASAGRFRDIAEAQSVDIFLSNHPTRDGALNSLAQLADRSAGTPHPFVAGEQAIGAFELLRDCALAQAESIKSGEKRTAP